MGPPMLPRPAKPIRASPAQVPVEARRDEADRRVDAVELARERVHPIPRAHVPDGERARIRPELADAVAEQVQLHARSRTPRFVERADVVPRRIGREIEELADVELPAPVDGLEQRLVAARVVDAGPELERLLEPVGFA